jgi:hypothetical protein
MLHIEKSFEQTLSPLNTTLRHNFRQQRERRQVLGDVLSKRNQLIDSIIPQPSNVSTPTFSNFASSTAAMPSDEESVAAPMESLATDEVNNIDLPVNNAGLGTTAIMNRSLVPGSRALSTNISTIKNRTLRSKATGEGLKRMKGKNADHKVFIVIVQVLGFSSLSQAKSDYWVKFQKLANVRLALEAAEGGEEKAELEKEFRNQSNNAQTARRLVLE